MVRPLARGRSPITLLAAIVVRRSVVRRMDSYVNHSSHTCKQNVIIIIVSDILLSLGLFFFGLLFSVLGFISFTCDDVCNGSDGLMFSTHLASWLPTEPLSGIRNTVWNVLNVHSKNMTPILY